MWCNRPACSPKGPCRRPWSSPSASGSRRLRLRCFGGWRRRRLLLGRGPRRAQREAAAEQCQGKRSLQVQRHQKSFWFVRVPTAGTNRVRRASQREATHWALRLIGEVRCSSPRIEATYGRSGFKAAFNRVAWRSSGSAVNPWCPCESRQDRLALPCHVFASLRHASSGTFRMSPHSGDEPAALNGLNALLATAARNCPDHVIVEDDCGPVTVARFVHRASTLASHLRSGGLQSGERVLVVAGAQAAALVAIAAVLRAGLEPVLASCGANPVELATYARACDAVALIGTMERSTSATSTCRQRRSPRACAASSRKGRSGSMVPLMSRSMRSMHRRCRTWPMRRSQNARHSLRWQARSSRRG